MTAPRTTVTGVEPLDGRWLRLTFADGAVHELDLAPVLQAGGVFSAIHDDDETFRAVEVDREFGTIVWPGAPRAASGPDEITPMTARPRTWVVSALGSQAQQFAVYELPHAPPGGHRIRHSGHF